MKPEYKIIYSDDWCVAVKKVEGRPLEVLYEHHDMEPAYRAILKDIGIEIPCEYIKDEDDGKLMERGSWDYEDLEKYFE